MDLYLNRILKYSSKYANRKKRKTIRPSDISQAMLHQGGGIDLTNDTTFCGGNITQCYDFPKSCMSQSAGGKKTNVKINIKKFNNMVKTRLRMLYPRFRISNPSLNMLHSLLV